MADVIMNRTNGTIDATGGATFATTMGNVGIGTTTPGTKLETFYDGTTYSITDYNSPTIYVRGANTNGDHNLIGFSAAGGNREASFGTTQISSGIADFIWHGHNGSAYVEYMRIKGETGNVGIGTTIPSRKLEVNGNIQIENDVTLNHSQGIYWYSSDGYGIYRKGGSWPQPLLTSFFTGTEFYCGQYYQHNFIINSSTILTLDENIVTVGKLLKVEGREINTTPFTNTIAGIRLSNTYTSAFDSGSDIVFCTSAGGAAKLSGIMGIYNRYGTEVGGSLLFGTNAGYGSGIVERLRIDPDGNVGIGTADPITPLHINSPTGDCHLTIQRKTAGGTNYAQWGLVAGIWGSNDFWIRDEKQGLDRFLINNNGYVGIGTTAPISKFHVDGNITVNAAQTIGWRYTSGDPGPYTYITNNGAGAMNFYTTWGSTPTNSIFNFFGGNTTPVMSLLQGGNIGIGTTTPGAQLELSGAVAWKSSGTAWANPSDARLKENISLADLDRCYEIIKNVPLKRYTLRTDAFTITQAIDRSKIGWIADDVEPYFIKSTPKSTFTLNTQTPAGTETYEEQDYTTEIITTSKTEIQIINNEPIQVIITGTTENKTLLFDDVIVKDISGNTVYISGTTPLTYQMPRMVTKTRDKYIPDTIEDCRTLDVDQLYAAMYGALQKLMSTVEDNTSKINTLIGTI